MWLKLLWRDNRLTIDLNNTQVEVFDDIWVTTIKNHQILHHLWLPDIYIPHQKLSKVSHGPGFHDEVITVTVKDGNIWVDYWRWLKLTTTCPMSFNWFPLDEQNCYVSIQVGRCYRTDLIVNVAGRGTC